MDRHVHASNYWRMQESLKCFVRRGECPLLQLVARELRTSDARKAMNCAQELGIGTTTATSQEELLHRIATEQRLNDSQRAALAAVTGRHLTLIQGPPGTGKTSLAIALLRFMRELHQGRSLAAAPSNAAADNIARRLRGHLQVGRYVQQVSDDLVDKSTMAMAEKAQGSGANRKAIK